MTRTELQREIGFFSAMMVVVASMIGTGIFTTSGFIIQELGNPVNMLLCWFVGGVFALCGALCYGELGAMYPMAGGEYVFLRESFGKWMGFLSGWISLIVGFSAAIAAGSIAFSTYFFSSFSPSLGQEVSKPFLDVGVLSMSLNSLLAISAIIILSLVHYYSLLFGSRVQNTMTIFKIGFIVLFVLAGFFLGNGSTTNFSKGLEINSVFQGNFAISLIFVSFAYSGWNAAVYLGAEINRPRRNIPLALFSGTFLVMMLYMLLNLVYIYAAPAKDLSGVLEIGKKSAFFLFGNDASKYFGGAIGICILSVLGAVLMTGPRVYYAMAKDGVFFELFGKISKIHHTPANAIFLQAAIAIVMVLTASFDKLLLYTGFTLSLFAMCTVVGLILLRKSQPGLARSYKTFGYPLTPLLFILGNLWIIYFSIRMRPIVSLWGLGTIGSGVLAYLCFRKRSKCDLGT